jgi:DNA-directed RNA polymerase alpha subunit
MNLITKEQYESALTICQQYRAQIISDFHDELIRTFIQDNMDRMSTRCFNMLEKATTKGYVTISELTVARLMNIPGTGIVTIHEFQKLIK